MAVKCMLDTGGGQGLLEPHSVEKELTVNAKHIEGRWEHCSLTPGRNWE